jgi:hypothetical protein
MKTSNLFGLKFALNFNFKAQVIYDFKRWKRAKQYFLAEDLNRKKLFERILKEYIDQHPKDDRSLEIIADELWESLLVEVAKTNWQHVFEKKLGNDIEKPGDQLSHHISREHTKELFRERSAKDGTQCNHFYFTESAVEECEKVNITELDMDWLRDAKDDKRQINWGDNFIRYEKKDNRIIAVAASFTRRQECKYLQHTFFVFDLNIPKVQYDLIADIVKEQCEKDDEDDRRGFEKKMQELLYKMITFLDLLPLKKIKLPKWGCLEDEHEVKKVESVYNNQNIPLTVVTVTPNWNSSIFIEETTVKNYYKNVKCRGRVIKRFIKKHQRSQHWRPAGKLKFSGYTSVTERDLIMQEKQGKAITGNGLGVAHKQISVTRNDSQSIGIRRDISNQQESPDILQLKLEQLKKKFNQTG